MIQLQQNISLKPFNTFGIDAIAKGFAAVASGEELKEVFEKINPNEQWLVLGGGSNILFTKNFDGVVIKNELRGIHILRDDEHHFYVKAAAGESWHQLVMYCVANNYAGVENLSLIPGNVGASPMQNIGAYGVEVKDVFYELEAYDVIKKTIITFTKEDCGFGYRESVFKHKYKGRFVILNVTFQLDKNPVFHTGYGAIQQELERMKVSQLSIAAISQAVINIRKSKLPDPAIIGNAGSFFKNPTIDNEQFLTLKNANQDIVGFATNSGKTKLAAGWLIEKCGWKGYRKEDAGCYDKQALVLVNYGGATGNEIYNLSQQIIETVEQKFDITLEREVNIV
ncbi:MAG: UDP-N-acetylmuramate dehydrogenase [Bacteroidota bacterium]|nr:UDP-N-acetylmuramate dehydrogenase [Bacteroidota bacterium]